MIVIARNYGQLGNRLFLYAHMIAAARHHGVSLANPCFTEYAHLFPSTANDLWCRYPVLPRDSNPPSLRQRQALAKSIYLAARGLDLLQLRRYPVNVLRLRGDTSCDLASEEFAKLVTQDRHLLALGWLFRSESLMARHADIVRDHFQIAPENRRRVDGVIASIREQADVVVGVHIRHGDYETFLGGRYFYSIDQYATVMRQIAEQMPGKRVAFLVCSNTPLRREEFGELQVHLGPGQIIEDMYSFAATDLLIGPPSTYTGWASFYGNVPLVVMDRAETTVNVAQELGRRAA